ncbi:MAG: CocE/NonD family hydrolase, partial [Chloroflexi bacterium]|nr:CocE/NonD family hydrolase [Chloroflexota bacterium]
MRDGVRLATDIYRPAASGNYPAILVRTPYGKDGLSDDGAFFAQHGYAYVAQDTRGRANSEGIFDMYVQDDKDGLDAALWLNQQPWFSQEQGFAVYGDSYLASTALSAAEMSPPNLKAAYVSFASANYHSDGAWRGGAFQLAHNVYLTAVTECPEQIARASASQVAPRIPLPGGGD